MNKNRRLFINKLAIMAGAVAFNKPLAAVAAVDKKKQTLYASKNRVCIYYTNDLHGNLPPAINNRGGLNSIKSLLEKQEAKRLLIDGGGFLNATALNEQNQQVINLMNSTGYCASTIGPHELANGQDYLAALIPFTQFSLVNCNYQFTGVLKKMVKPFITVNSGKLKIGITGVGRQVEGIGYHDPVACANRNAKVLKETEQCDMVICLSQLGHVQDGNLADNKKLAAQSEHIDMIIGTGNQNFFSGPLVLRNKNKHEIILGNAGRDGLMFGRINFGFESGKQKSGIAAKHFITGQTNGQSFAESFSKLRQLEKELKPA